MDRELSESFLDHTGEYEEARHIAAVVLFRRELKKIDPLLDVIYAKPNAQYLPKGNRFYIIRRNPLCPPTFWLVEDEYENYCEPDYRHLQKMKQMDSARSNDVAEGIRREAERKQEEKARKKAERSERFRELALERLSHALDKRIAVPRDA
jgi:hypothetical protein